METIGAHFSAIRPLGLHSPPGNYAFESARSCLFALLDAIKPKVVYVPNYLCDAVSRTVLQAGAVPRFYPIEANFRVAKNVDVSYGELLLLVDYFGLAADAVTEALDSVHRSSVVVDCSQAYFQEPFQCLATVYSARKFIPVADGGFIETTAGLQYDAATDEAGSIWRYECLRNRVDSEPELSRTAYLAAEKSLESVSKRKISEFSGSIVRSTDGGEIAYRRRENFKSLSEAFQNVNRLAIRLGEQVPLCYPLQVRNGEALRRELRSERILSPVYWSDVKPMNKFEAELVENTVFIPIDHRYGADHMRFVADKVLAWFRRGGGR